MKRPLLVALIACLTFVSAGQALAEWLGPIPPIEPEATNPNGCAKECVCDVGEPVNIGSGAVSTSLALFTITESPLPVELTLSYHSITLIPAGARRPLGEGWTHSFNMSLHPVSGGRLELITAHGHHWFFTGTGPSTWMATVPAASRDRIDTSGGHYVLTTQEGERTLFDLGSGRWLSTSDRWGNTIRGLYDTEGNLSSVVDALERVFRFDHSGGLLTGIALPGEGLTWQFIYSTQSQL
ncbi:MAG TPA: DUF6531 domain-containing protein, partial [Thermoanaerobaculia bacterium]|nr:DUF6531 domain-containing protein [Thermoanaerobaculia bacterium]